MGGGGGEAGDVVARGQGVVRSFSFFFVERKKGEKLTLSFSTTKNN